MDAAEASLRPNGLIHRPRDRRLSRKARTDVGKPSDWTFDSRQTDGQGFVTVVLYSIRV